MKKKLSIIIVLFIFASILGQAQIIKRKHYKPVKRRRLVPAVTLNNAPFFSQGNIFFTSNNRDLLAHFILRNNNSNGPVINNAKVYVNGSIIKMTQKPGEYKGLVPVLRNNYGKYPLNIKIITPNKRILTASGIVNFTIKMQISNIFPRQPNKIDVGTPVRINWQFTPQNYSPVTLTLTNTRNNDNIFQRVINRNGITLKTNIIPRRKTIKFKVKAPVIRLKYNGRTSPGSSLKVHIKDAKILHTFG